MKQGDSTLNDPAMKRFRAALDALYGEQIERVVLYGSRARGDFADESDYDVAVFLKNSSDRWEEIRKISVAATEVFFETGAVINAIPFQEGAYREKTPLMHELRREGRDL